MFSSSLRLPRWIAPAPQGEERQTTISSLDGVRAIACLIVIAYHISLITRDLRIWHPGSAQHQVLTSLLLSGFSGVTLFFVLSGFLLFLPYARALLYNETWPSIRQFYLRRALRIIPAYYAALLLLLLFPVLQPQPIPSLSAWNVGLFLSFLMDSTKATFEQINGPFWTLAVEWQFYMLLPVLTLGMRIFTRRLASAQKRFRAVSGCLLLLIVWGVGWRVWGLRASAQLALSNTPGAHIKSILLVLFYGSKGKFLEDFAVGMLICLAYVYAQRVSGDRLAQWLGQTCFWFWGIGIWLLFYTATSWPWSLFQHFPALVHDSLVELLYACGYGLCILAILFNRAILQRCFSWSPLRSLGQISFSLYMWHLPLLVLLMNSLEHRFTGGNPCAIYILQWVYVGLVIIPFCANFYRLFEKPGMLLADSMRKKRARQGLRPQSKMQLDLRNQVSQVKPSLRRSHAESR